MLLVSKQSNLVGELIEIIYKIQKPSNPHPRKHISGPSHARNFSSSAAKNRREKNSRVNAAAANADNRHGTSYPPYQCNRQPVAAGRISTVPPPRSGCDGSAT